MASLVDPHNQLCLPAHCKPDCPRHNTFCLLLPRCTPWPQVLHVNTSSPDHHNALVLACKIHSIDGAELLLRHCPRHQLAHGNTENYVKRGALSFAAGEGLVHVLRLMLRTRGERLGSWVRGCRSRGRGSRGRGRTMIMWCPKTWRTNTPWP